MTGDGPADALAPEPWLLAAPRGRRLCYEVLTTAVDRALPFVVWDREPAAGVGVGVGVELAGLVELLPEGEPLGDDEPRLLAALVESVAAAMYWQPSHPEDRGLAAPEARRALRPVAAALEHALPAWWGEPVDLERQRVVAWAGPGLPAEPALTGSAQALAQWRRETVDDERRAQRERPAAVTARWSGRWWSTPAGRRPPKTSRALDVVGAAGLVLVEDSLGWTAARCVPVEPVRPVRVHEVHGPADWVDLVERHPLEVTFSRRHDWWRTTGVEGRWLIPDWAAVAQDVDAVHVSVRGYLRTAGLPPRAGDGWTLMAGWEPDATWWLTDCLRVVGEPEHWVRADRDPLGWLRGQPEEPAER